MSSVSERPAEMDIDENVRLAQKLARDLRSTRDVRRAFEISRELARVSRELKEATRIEAELAKQDRTLRTAGY